jgi:nitroreductase
MNTSTEEQNLLTSLKWRYATKRFDATKKIPETTWKTLEEALRLSPSSFGLQPWHFVVVTNPEIRQELLAHSWNQPQIVEASHLVVIASARQIDEQSIASYIKFVAETRSNTPQSLEQYQGMITQFVKRLTDSNTLEAWTAKQTYIALGTLLTAAAMLRIDACPLEGIISNQYDKVLGLDTGLFSTRVACALGYRSEQDSAASLTKVRYPHDRMFSYRS